MTRVSRTVGLVAALASLVSGCGLISVEMTSTPDVVRPGEPVTFNLKLTNRSQCPVDPPEVELIAFIPVQDFFFGIAGEIPAGNGELNGLIEALQEFFDVLCAGGTPTPPDMMVATTAGCARGDGEIVCTATGPAPGSSEPVGDLSFATLGNRLRCQINGGVMSCSVHIPVTPISTAGSASAALTTNLPLECATGQQLGENGAICAVGSLQMPLGLAGGQMATGQVMLNAVGGGLVRNLVFVFQDSEDDLGVCRGGTEAGEPCELDDDDCEGGECEPGICVGGGNDGLGCDPQMVMTHCPDDGTCALCETATSPGLPLDCTETRIAAQPAPVMSPWALAAVAGVLFAVGMFWLQRRRA